MHALVAVSSYCVKKSDFCNKSIQAAKDTAGGGLTLNTVAANYSLVTRDYKQRLTVCI